LRCDLDGARLTVDAQSFEGVLERDPGGTWWFVHVPATVRQRMKPPARRGVLPVTATIGRTSWPGSLLPWADGSAQITVNKRVRAAERLEQGQTVTVRVEPRDP
jgi:hypothetical protein